MKRKRLLIYLTLTISIIYIAKLFYMQVYSFDEKNTLTSSAVKIKYDYPERGYIYDRNGVLLVANQLSYDIMVVPREIKNLDTIELCSLLGINKEYFLEKIEKAKQYSYRIPSTFLPQVSKKDYAYIQEKMHKFKGFHIQKKSIRKYPIKSAPNVLGYISEVNETILKKNKNYQLGELIGTAGVEKTYEKALKGIKGVQYIQRNKFNKEIGSFKNQKYDTASVPGHDLTLTIDTKLQQYGEALMANKRGAIVAIEPSSGEILSLITSPSYDPNLMVGRERSKNFNQLYKDPSKPLFDRGLLGQYPPASPFKVITALVALQEKTINTNTAIQCFGGYKYGSKRTDFMACHCQIHGTVKLNKAIYRSCNSYFADAYKKTIEKYPTASEGMDTWNKHVTSFGLGNYLHNDLSVGQPGLVPSGEFYNKWYPNVKWRATYTISNSIGQGELQTTPIQLANMTAAIANKGYYYTPHIVKKIKDEKINTKYTTKKFTTIKSEYFEPIIEGLFNVFEHPRGTASWSKVKGLEICGKTGTAENPHGQDHSIFIAFAPKNKPKIAIAVFIENGYWGSRWAGPIASLMVEKYLKGTISKPWEEQRMLNGSLQDEYDKQLKELEQKNEKQE